VAKSPHSGHHSVVNLDYEKSIARARSAVRGLLALATALLTGVSCSTVDITSRSAFSNETGGCIRTADSDTIESPLLSVLTLNLAHGRGDAFNQMLQKSSTTRRNLDQVAAFISSSGADIVALQEADAASRWSGGFNHVDYISAKSPYPCGIHASHAKKYMYDFGTALLSPVPLTNGLQHGFTPSPPTTNKGFVMGEVLWNPDGKLAQAIPVSIISVHLDFSRKKVREAQIEEMRTALPDLARPLIILGDFNTDWSKDGSVLQAIADNGNLKVFRPYSTELGTYKNGKHRLDWILISTELEFVSYDVPQLELSDHQPVTASFELVAISSEETDSKANASHPDNGHE
jgi:endonuclease/exonuclease/phosphatase family metal-dependent hydrolase